MMKFAAFKEKKKFGNVLDALSVAYWTEKIGAKFDTPPRMEVDVEREKERLRKRDEITQKQNDISAERMRKKKEMGLIQSLQIFPFYLNFLPLCLHLLLPLPLLLLHLLEAEVMPYPLLVQLS